MADYNNTPDARQAGAAERPRKKSGGWRDIDVNNAPLYRDPPERTAVPKSQRPVGQRAAGQGIPQRQAQPKAERPAGKPKKKRAGPLPPWLLVLVSFLYSTLLFHLWAHHSINFSRAIGILLFSLAYGMLNALIATISRKRKVHTILALVVSIGWIAIYLLEYGLFDSFKVFFTPKGIFSGGGNAEQADFAKATLRLITSQIWRIPVIALPIIAYFLANKYLRFRRILTRGVRRYLFVGGVGFLTVACFFSLLISKDSPKLRSLYNTNAFTDAVDCFGLPTALFREQIEQFKGEKSSTEDLADIETRDLEGSLLPWEIGSGETPVDEPPIPNGSESNPVNPRPTDPTNPTDPTRPTEPTPSDGPNPSESETPSGTDPEPSVPPDTTEPVTPRPTTNKQYNVMQIDYRSLIPATTSDTIKAIHNYVYSLEPSKTNQYTGLFAGKNLILICAEAFSAEVIDPELTPTLYRMATKGIHFTDFYQPAWGGSTSTGEYSVFTGLVPTNGVNSIQDTIGHNMYLTMGNQLKRLGYFSRAYHNGSYTYYSRNKTHENMGYEKFIGMGNGMEEGVRQVWPESDESMIKFTVPQYLDKQPFSIYYMTVSGHTNYSWLGNTQAKYNKPAVEHLNRSETIKAYLACNLEVEYAMRDLIEMLEEAGIANDTVIVICADHYPYGLEKSATWGNDEDYLKELYGYAADDCFKQDHNALIIWSGCLEGMNLEIDTPTYSLDILPTLSNLFGVDYDSRLLVGRDVFSNADPLVLWPNYSWKTDLGKYNSRTGDFTPAAGKTIPDGYVEQITKIVKQKISFSDAVLENDYYHILFD